jgi:polyhydroxyalkanoate synthesis regulator phasin
MNRSLENAVEEADRAGYVSAEEGRRRVDELLRQIDQRAQYGEAERERAFYDMVAEDQALGLYDE